MPLFSSHHKLRPAIDLVRHLHDAWWKLCEKQEKLRGLRAAGKAKDHIEKATKSAEKAADDLCKYVLDVRHVVHDSAAGEFAVKPDTIMELLAVLLAEGPCSDPHDSNIVAPPHTLLLLLDNLEGLPFDARRSVVMIVSNVMQRSCSTYQDPVRYFCSVRFTLFDILVRGMHRPQCSTHTGTLLTEFLKYPALVSTFLLRGLEEPEPHAAPAADGAQYVYPSAAAKPAILAAYDGAGPRRTPLDVVVPISTSPPLSPRALSPGGRELGDNGAAGSGAAVTRTLSPPLSGALSSQTAPTGIALDTPLTLPSSAQWNVCVCSHCTIDDCQIPTSFCKKLDRLLSLSAVKNEDVSQALVHRTIVMTVEESGGSGALLAKWPSVTFRFGWLWCIFAAANSDRFDMSAEALSVIALLFTGPHKRIIRALWTEAYPCIMRRILKLLSANPNPHSNFPRFPSCSTVTPSFTGSVAPDEPMASPTSPCAKKKAPNYAMRRQTLEMLQLLLSDPAMAPVMKLCAGDPNFFVAIMNLLKVASVPIHVLAFNIFRLLILVEPAPPHILRVVSKNAEELKRFLEKLHAENQNVRALDDCLRVSFYIDTRRCKLEPFLHNVSLMNRFSLSARCFRPTRQDESLVADIAEVVRHLVSLPEPPPRRKHNHPGD